MEQFKNTILIAFFAISFFSFGWLSHSAYSPIHKIKKPSILDKIKKEKELRVVLLNAPSTYYIGTDGAKGFEYDLLKAYAKHLDVKLNITVADTVKEAISLGKNPKIHIISASFTKTPQREKKYNFGPSYFEVQEQVVCNRDLHKNKKFPRNLETLAGLNIKIADETSYSETAKKLLKDGYDLNVTFSSVYSTEELLEQVSEHQIDCTIVDSNIFDLNLRYYPEMDMAFTVSEREQLAWVLPKGADDLEIDMYSWLNDFNQRGRLASLKDHYYSYVHYFDYYDNKMFNKRIKTILPKYIDLFKEVGERYHIDWKLLAAISYQESHWNPHAKSFTGVRGMMMLTRSTAKLLGVKNRLDPRQSIKGGTRHLKQMLKFVHKDVKGENRLKFALGAYNIGMGHILDAMKLTKKLGLNQYIWSDLKQVLPLLSKKRFYRHLKYGYARGSEPVKYVESIYSFRNILENNFKEIDKEKE
jgi:membrane-bound lytic murein transglycosylase F